MCEPGEREHMTSLFLLLAGTFTERRKFLVPPPRPTATVPHLLFFFFHFLLSHFPGGIRLSQLSFPAWLRTRSSGSRGPAGPEPFHWPGFFKRDQMLGFKELKPDVDEQLPAKHSNPQCCNVFNFTPSDGVAPVF